MEHPVRRFLLTVDESPESLRPIGFLVKLYPQLDNVGVLICYFYAPLAPVYQQQPLTSTMVAKKEELLKARYENAKAILYKARQVLTEVGFASENIQEHMQERSVSQAQHSCSLGSIKRVDGVLVQKTISGKLEGLLRAGSFPIHLEHCLASPVWFLEGTKINSGRAVVCMHPEQASLRAARYAASMLAASDTHIDLLHCDPQLNWAVACGVDGNVSELRSWEETPNGQLLTPYLQQTQHILMQEGIAADRIRIVILPVRGDVASCILEHCRQDNAGIAVLGHSKPHGVWSFLQNSVTKKVLAEFRNMAIWVVQQGTRSTHEDSCC